jgi:hypothetical protein
MKADTRQRQLTSSVQLICAFSSVSPNKSTMSK